MQNENQYIQWCYIIQLERCLGLSYLFLHYSIIITSKRHCTLILIVFRFVETSRRVDLIAAIRYLWHCYPNKNKQQIQTTSKCDNEEKRDRVQTSLKYHFYMIYVKRFRNIMHNKTLMIQNTDNIKLEKLCNSLFLSLMIENLGKTKKEVTGQIWK